MRETRNTYRILEVKLVEKHPLESQRKSWDDNIKIDLREVSCNNGVGE